jgi:hypothetical protein
MWPLSKTNDLSEVCRKESRWWGMIDFVRKVLTFGVTELMEASAANRAP